MVIYYRLDGNRAVQPFLFSDTDIWKYSNMNVAWQ